MYNKNVSKEECIRQHKQAFEALDRPLIITVDEDGYMLIRWSFKDNRAEQYYHYAEDNNQIIWW